MRDIDYLYNLNSIHWNYHSLPIKWSLLVLPLKLLVTAAKMDVASNDNSLTEIQKYFVILISRIHNDREISQKLEDRKNFRIYSMRAEKFFVGVLSYM